jgi:Ala-tRNA(Pro) deacylase
MDLNQLYRNNISILHKAGVRYSQYDHEPVLTYEKAAEIRARFNLKGVESKSLFLKLQDSRYCMFVSIEGERIDGKEIKLITGSKPRICSDDELTKITGCVPGCAVPFGHAPEVILIIDRKIFKHERYIFSPGPPEKTIEISTRDIEKILDNSPNKIIHYPFSKPATGKGTNNDG